MAEIIRGKDKGTAVTIDQWCNDWFTIKEMDVVRGGTVSATSIKLNESETREVRESIEQGRAGQMGNWFDLLDNGTFRRKPRSTC